MGDFRHGKDDIGRALANRAWRVRHRPFGVEAFGRKSETGATVLYASAHSAVETDMLLAYADSIYAPATGVRLLFARQDAEDEAYDVVLRGAARAYAIGYDPSLPAGVYVADGVINAGSVTARLNFASEKQSATAALLAFTATLEDEHVRVQASPIEEGAAVTISAYDPDLVEERFMRLSRHLADTEYRLVVTSAVPPLRCAPAAAAVLAQIGESKAYTPSFVSHPFARIAARVPAGFAWIGGEDRQKATAQAARIYAHLAAHTVS